MKPRPTTRKKRRTRTCPAWALMTSEGTPLAVRFNPRSFPYYEAKMLRRCIVIIEVSR